MGGNALRRVGRTFAARRAERQTAMDRTSWGNNIGRAANAVQDRAIGYIPLLGRDATARADRARQDRRRTNVADEATRLENTVTPNALRNNINAIVNPATGGAAANITEAQAAHARAYSRQSGDQQRNNLRIELTNTFRTTGNSMTNLANIQAAAVATGNAAITDAIAAINADLLAGRQINNDQLNTINGFMVQIANEGERAHINA